MINLRERAEELLEFIGNNSQISMVGEIVYESGVTATIEQALREAYTQGIEDAARLVQEDGRYTLTGFRSSGTDLPKNIRALAKENT